MRAFFLISCGLLWPALAWAADSVDIRIAVVLAKEKKPEEALTPEIFEEQRRHKHRHKHKEARLREKCERRGRCQEVDEPEGADFLPMKRALGLRRHYGWLERFSKKRMRVDAQGEEIELPGGATARVRLQALKDDVATLVVSLPNTETVYQLGRTGSLYLQAGKHEDKDVWVVISPKKLFR